MNQCLSILVGKKINKNANVLSPILIVYKKKLKYYKLQPGNFCEGATPDPIPNSVVKSFSADGTLS